MWQPLGTKYGLSADFCSLLRHVEHLRRIPLALVNTLWRDRGDALVRRDFDPLWLARVLCAGPLAR